METKKQSKHLFIIRLVVGIIFLFFGILHLIRPENFHNILKASQAPLVGLNTVLVPILETAMGLLLVIGLFTRLAALAGVVIMTIAAWSTRILMHLEPSQLPSGMTEKPFYPPIFIPIVLSLLCLYLLIFGCGKWGLDKKFRKK